MAEQPRMREAAQAVLDALPPIVRPTYTATDEEWRQFHLATDALGAALVRSDWCDECEGPHETETCNECGRPYHYVWWCHDPVLWEAVTGHAKPPGDNAGGTWCIDCFDRKAKELCPWLEWSPLNQRHLTFVREEES